VPDETTPAEPDEQTSGQQPAEAAAAQEQQAESPEPASAPDDESAADQAAPAELASSDQAAPPGEASSDQSAPAEEAPDQGAPAEEASDEGAPAEAASGAESSEGDSGDAATAEAPAEPAAQAPAEPAAAEPAPKPRPPVTGKSAGTGRRKEAVARVRLVPGTGQFDLGGRTLEQVFPNRAHRMEITAPLRLADHDQDLDVLARITGGGVSGQAGALRHGIARALVELDPALRPTLKAEGFLTRDSREKERRKYGLKKARKAPQYSKR